MAPAGNPVTPFGPLPTQPAQQTAEDGDEGGPGLSRDDAAFIADDGADNAPQGSAFSARRSPRWVDPPVGDFICHEAKGIQFVEHRTGTRRRTGDGSGGEPPAVGTQESSPKALHTSHPEPSRHEMRHL